MIRHAAQQREPLEEPPASLTGALQSKSHLEVGEAMADDVFKLPGSSYERVAQLIQGYTHLKDPVNAGDVGKLVSVDASEVSRNNGFLLALGIIDGGQKKGITELGKALGLALDHGIESEVSRCWQAVVDQSDFLEKILSAVRIRGGMDEDTLQAHIAYTAGQKRGQKVMIGATAVIQILRASGYLVEDDGKLVVAGDPSGPPASREEDGGRGPAQGTPAVETGTPSGSPVFSTELRGVGHVAVHVNVNIECTAQDVESLGPALKSLVESLGDLSSDDGE